MALKTAVIIPFRDRGTDPLRLANLVRVKQHWSDFGAELIITDDGRRGPEQFNRSAAYNRGAAQTDAGVLIFAEADFLVPHEQIRVAVSKAVGARGVVVPFTDYAALNEQDSEAVRTGSKEPADCEPTARAMSESGPVTVMSRATLAAVGCFDEGFTGHGYDDLAMELAFSLAAGPIRFVGGPGYHLHHAPGYGGDHLSNADKAAIAANKARYRLYEQARAKAAQEVRLFTQGQAQVESAPAGRIVLGLPLYRWVPASFFSRFLSLDSSPVVATIAIDGAYICEAFNTIVGRALQDIPGWSRLVVLEHDMICQYDALVRMANYSPEYAVVGGMYFGRGEPHDCLVYIENGGSYSPITPETAEAWISKPGLYKVDGIGFGLVSFARHVLESWPKDTPMFDIRDDLGSHDLYFCREARRLGHSIYVDSGAVCDHLGEQRIGLAQNQAHARATSGSEIEFVR